MADIKKTTLKLQIRRWKTLALALSSANFILNMTPICFRNHYAALYHGRYFDCKGKICNSFASTP